MVKQPRKIADGVWLCVGGIPPRMNVYLIEDEGGGVTMFDSGIAEMAKGLKRITSQMGGLNRIVLGHGHVDHRGAAPALGAPVLCHADDV
ncbi:MAG: MBL fold metallo-hydrolase, partial [Actinomycetota bacterium]